jgi:hypothetical protein
MPLPPPKLPPPPPPPKTVVLPPKTDIIPQPALDVQPPILAVTPVAAPAGPTTTAAAPPADPAASPPREGSDAAPTGPPKVGDRCGTWLCKEDEKLKKMYFKDTSVKPHRTTWKIADTPWARFAPAAEVTDASATTVPASPPPASMSTSFDASASLEEAKQPVVRDGWRRKFDTATGKFFFTNLATKKTQWSPVGTPFDESQTAHGSAVPAGTASPVQGSPTAATAGTAPVVVDGWLRKWNPDKSKFYYTELATKKTQWSAVGTPFEKET